MLKIQHLVTVAKSGIHHPQASSRIAYIEFYVKAEEDE